MRYLSQPSTLLDMTQDKNESNITPMPEKYVPIKVVCQHFDISETTVRKLIKKGLPQLRVGIEYRFKISDVERWLIEQKK